MSKSMRLEICTGLPVAPLYLLELVYLRAWATLDVESYGVLDMARSCVQHGWCTVYSSMANGRVDFLTIGVYCADIFPLLYLLSAW